MSAPLAISPESVRTILCVCTGNSCRSVMVQGLLRQALKVSRPDVSVLSAGVGTWGGLGATAETVAALRHRGIDVSDHVSRPVTGDLVRRADLVLAMTQDHREALVRRYPEAASKVVILKTFQAEPPISDPDVPDPIGQPMEVYEQCVAVIHEAVGRVARWLASTQ